AAVGQGVAADARALANLEGEVALLLEELRADDADREKHQSQVDEVAAVALAMPTDEHGKGAGIGFAVAVADAHTTPELVEHGGGGESADGKGDVGPEIRHAEEWQDEGAEPGDQCRPAEVVPDAWRGRTAPGQQRPHTHRQEEEEEEWAVHPLIEGRP